MKNLISSARPISGKPRSCASSSAENTSLVATGVPSPEDQTPTENTYPTWMRHAQQNRPIQPHPARRYLAVMLNVGFPLDDPSRPVGVAALAPHLDPSQVHRIGRPAHIPRPGLPSALPPLSHPGIAPAHMACRNLPLSAAFPSFDRDGLLGGSQDGGRPLVFRGRPPGGGADVLRGLAALGPGQPRPDLLRRVLRGQGGKDAHLDAAASRDGRAVLRHGHRCLKIVSGDDRVAAELSGLPALTERCGRLKTGQPGSTTLGAMTSLMNAPTPPGHRGQRRRRNPSRSGS